MSAVDRSNSYDPRATPSHGHGRIRGLGRVLLYVPLIIFSIFMLVPFAAYGIARGNHNLVAAMARGV